MSANKYPAIEGLFTWPSDDPRLIAALCDDCGTYSFPSSSPKHRPNCLGEHVREVELSASGTLVSWTIQRYAPPPPYHADPDSFEPFAIGIVSLPEGVQIPGQMTGVDLDAIRVGIEVDVVIDTLYVDGDGHKALTWKLSPAGSTS